MLFRSDFKKVASEARALQERMTALYEDCGRVLGRYFEIKEMGQPDGMGTIDGESENEKIVNAHAGIREGLPGLFSGGNRGMGGGILQHSWADAARDAESDSDKYKKYVERIRKTGKKPLTFEKWKLRQREGVNEVDGMCESCGKPMEQCECVTNEGLPGLFTGNRGMGSGILQHSWADQAEKATSDSDKYKEYVARIKKTGKTPLSFEKWKLRQREGTNESISPTGGKTAFKSMKLKNLIEDINDDRPKDDWVKLDVPMLRYDIALDFEKDLKKKFDVRRHDWKERAQQGQEFSEFYVKKDDFNEANKYAVGAYQSFENNARKEI